MSDGCRYITNEDAWGEPPVWCGKKRYAGTTYCYSHAARLGVSGARWEKSAGRSPLPAGVLDLAAAVDHLGIGMGRLRAALREGRGPRHHRDGRYYRFRVEDLDAWARKCQK